MELKPSPSFAVLLLLMHILVALAVFLAEMPLPAKLWLFLLITISLIFHLARDVLLLLPNSWCDVSLIPGMQLVTTRDGLRRNIANVGISMVSPYFVVLTIGMEGKYLPSSRVIFPDALAPGEYRKLCVLLKFG